MSPFLLVRSISILVLSQQVGRVVVPDGIELGTPEVPLTHVGLGVVGTNGIAFLDADADGWPDVFNNASRRLWLNQQGQSFLVVDLSGVAPAVPSYGASCADYDNDGLPDIAREPRGDCFHLLHNLGPGPSFVEVASDPSIVLDPPPCEMWAETFCWADVDDDGDVDLWAPAYLDPPASGGNHFFENLGPTGPGGAHRLLHRADAAGLQNDLGLSKPEGAQFVDVDRDGDVDGYANGTFYQNGSSTGAPLFRRFGGSALGILRTGRTDEGLLFLDHDLDGDQDLLVLYTGEANRLFDNEGDGTFAPTSDVLQRPVEGDFTGCSAEDWDLDGDLDLTTTHTFRRNMLVEEGRRFLQIVAESFGGALSPAWGDWDRDGDPDCVLSGWASPGGMGRNETYGPDTPLAAKRSVRVRAVRDSAAVERGLETEFGATVELRVHGDTSGFVRRRFVASSHGYLQQSEYALTMALPAGPDADAPALGVVFDVVVDFPSLPENEILRIDRSINPALGGIELAALADREITVYRSGKARIGGVEHAPRSRFSPRLRSTGALVTPELGATMPDPLPAPAPSWVVGLALDTRGAPGRSRVEELVLDGQLAADGGSRCGASVQLWDVTAGALPRLVSAERLVTSPRNDRSFLPVAWDLAPDRSYRVLCRVSELRASRRDASAAAAPLRVHGGLSFANPDPCQPFDPLGSAPDPERAYLELRYRVATP